MYEDENRFGKPKPQELLDDWKTVLQTVVKSPVNQSVDEDDERTQLYPVTAFSSLPSNLISSLSQFNRLTMHTLLPGAGLSRQHDSTFQFGLALALTVVNDSHTVVDFYEPDHPGSWTCSYFSECETRRYVDY